MHCPPVWLPTWGKNAKHLNCSLYETETFKHLYGFPPLYVTETFKSLKIVYENINNLISYSPSDKTLCDIFTYSTWWHFVVAVTKGTTMVRYNCYRTKPGTYVVSMHIHTIGQSTKQFYQQKQSRQQNKALHEFSKIRGNFYYLFFFVYFFLLHTFVYIFWIVSHISWNKSKY